MIHKLYDERHQYLKWERSGQLTPPGKRALAEVEASIDRLELEEHRERTEPFRREQESRLREIIERLRPLVPPEEMAALDESFAAWSKP